MGTPRFYLVEKCEHLAWVYLNKPDKRNAMGAGAWFEPVELMADLAAVEAAHRRPGLWPHAHQYHFGV